MFVFTLLLSLLLTAQLTFGREKEKNERRKVEIFHGKDIATDVCL